MWFVPVGIVMLLLKFLDVTFMEIIPWWACFIPFAAAFIYWEFIDMPFNISAKQNMRKQVKQDKKRKKDLAEEMLSEGRGRKTRAKKSRKPRKPN